MDSPNRRWTSVNVKTVALITYQYQNYKVHKVKITIEQRYSTWRSGKLHVILVKGIRSPMCRYTEQQSDLCAFKR